MLEQPTKYDIKQVVAEYGDRYELRLLVSTFQGEPIMSFILEVVETEEEAYKKGHIYQDLFGAIWRE